MENTKHLKYTAEIRNIILKEVDNPDLNGQVIGQKLGISRMHLHRKIKVATGQSIRNFILGIRIELAQELLIDSEMQITSIAYELGFKDASYFTRVFKKILNCTPSQFRVMWQIDKEIPQEDTPHMISQSSASYTVQGEHQRG